ncbi:hypothetical protein JD969_17885 [Planctomycetota bacterium]|nr:hypothetical protein JD969_17885 [Planctomycetota bacterium]
MKTIAKNIESLTETEIFNMYSVLNECFSGVSLSGFKQDMLDKNSVVILCSNDGKIQGFSTLSMCITKGPDGNSDVTIVCSGDTIVRPEAWGSTALPRAWMREARQKYEAQGKGPLYWLLITSGYRTFRFLPVFIKEYYPHPEKQTPPHLAQWMHQIATERWGDAYDPALGIVRFPQPQQLRGNLTEVPDSKMRDKHVQHFLKLNIGHENGDELVSICELSEENLTRPGLRFYHAADRYLHSTVASVAK